MVKLLSLFILVMMFVLLIPTGLVLASQNAVPGDASYPIKRKLEDIIIGAASIHPATKAYFRVDFSNRRFTETTKLFARGNNDEAFKSLEELIQKNQEALTEVRSLQDRKKRLELVTQIVKNLDEYDRQLKQIQSGSPITSPSESQPTPTPTPVLVQIPQRQGTEVVYIIVTATPTPRPVITQAPTPTTRPVIAGQPQTPTATPVPASAAPVAQAPTVQAPAAQPAPSAPKGLTAEEQKQMEDAARRLADQKKEAEEDARRAREQAAEEEPIIKNNNNPHSKAATPTPTPAPRSGGRGAQAVEDDIVQLPTRTPVLTSTPTPTPAVPAAIELDTGSLRVEQRSGNRVYVKAIGTGRTNLVVVYINNQPMGSTSSPTWENEDPLPVGPGEYIVKFVATEVSSGGQQTGQIMELPFSVQ